MIDFKYKLFDYTQHTVQYYPQIFAHIFFNYCTMLERTGI